MKTTITALVATMAIVIAGCQSNQPVATPSLAKTTAQQPVTYEQIYGQMSRGNVSMSDSMQAFANYYQSHPNEHTDEIRALADKWLSDKILDATRQGKQVKHFLTRDTNIQLGAPIWGLLGGEMSTPAQVTFYSHPIDQLTISAQENNFGPLTQIIYIKGRGIGVSGNLVYCFGF